VYPNCGGLDTTAAFTRDDGATFGPVRTKTATPRSEMKAFLENGKRMNAQRRSPHHPTVFVGVGSLARIVVGNVLEIPHTGIETQSAPGRDVTQSNTTFGLVHPSRRGQRRKFDVAGRGNCHTRTLLGKDFRDFFGEGVKSVDVGCGKWFPVSRMLNIVCAQPSGHRSASATAVAAVASYWHAATPAFAAAMFTNKRPSQRPDRSPT
jgi:hypothetical protein